MSTIDIDRQIACVRREITMRRKVYPRWVQSGRMTQDRADEQIAAMEAVQATLERVRAAESAKTAPGLF